jgi:hypothetical protein
MIVMDPPIFDGVDTGSLDSETTEEEDWNAIGAEVLCVSTYLKDLN